jgi:hypothetical protein
VAEFCVRRRSDRLREIPAHSATCVATIQILETALEKALESRLADGLSRG